MTFYNSNAALPQSELPPVLVHLAESLAREHHRDPDMLCMVGLSAASCVLHRQARVRPFREKRWEEALPVWLIVSAPSGYGKTHLLKPFIAPLQQIERNENERIELYVEKIENHYGKSKPPRSVLPSGFQRFTLTDTTPEGLATEMRLSRGSTDVITAEGRGFIKTMQGAYGGNGSPKASLSTEILCHGYDGGSIAIGRATGDRRDTIPHATSTLLILTQEDMFRDVFGALEMRTSGFLARMIVQTPHFDPQSVPPESERPTTDPYYIDQWRDTLHLIWEQRNDDLRFMEAYEPGLDPIRWPRMRDPSLDHVLETCSEGSRMLMDFSDRCGWDRGEGGRLQHESELALKLCGKAARIAAVLHALRNPSTFPRETIAERDVRLAIQIVEIEIQSRLKFWEGLLGGVDALTRKMARRVAKHALEKANGQVIAKRELSKWTHLNGEDLFPVVELIAAEGGFIWHGRVSRHTPREQDAWCVVAIPPVLRRIVDDDFHPPSSPTRTAPMGVPSDPQGV